MNTLSEAIKETALATHVIIAGNVFPWEAKAPYVASGRSVLGGLEYNEELDLVRCHLCGKWFACLNHHVASEEGVTGDEYRRDHGLMWNTPLKAFGRRSGSRQYRIDGTKKKKRNPPKVQYRARARYEPEALIREVKNLAATVGRTPTQAELRVSGINPGMLMAAMKVTTHTEAIRAMGLIPNPVGAPVADPEQPVTGKYVRARTEMRNLTGLCAAQIRCRLLVIARDLGRAATKTELKAAGLNGDTVPLALGYPNMREVWLSLGLKPGTRGLHGGSCGYLSRPQTQASAAA